MSDRLIELGFSVIVPVYNERDSLAKLHGEIRQTMIGFARSFEIIFIDDGSTDGSLKVLKSLADTDETIQIIVFSRNFGKSSAYTAGFAASRGEILFTLDSDLQDVPSEMPKLLAAVAQGKHLAIGWKQKRLKNEPLKKIPSFIYNFLKFRLFRIRLHDSNSGFRCIKRELAQSLDLYGDRYRFIPELAHMQGFSVTEVPTDHRPREFGSSKFGWWRFITGFFDLLSVRYISSYSFRPLQLFGVISLLSLILGGALELYVLQQKLSGSGFGIHLAAIVVGAMFIVLGFIFLAIGLLGEMITFNSAKPKFQLRNDPTGTDSGPPRE